MYLIFVFKNKYKNITCTYKFVFKCYNQTSIVYLYPDIYIFISPSPQGDMFHRLWLPLFDIGKIKIFIYIYAIMKINLCVGIKKKLFGCCIQIFLSIGLIENW